MPYGDLSSGVAFDMSRDTPFSYICGGCSRCCEGKAIRVGPYEVLRLARLLNMSTTNFISEHTTSGGTVLKLSEKGDCGFLTEKGCGVHTDRPLACRLYPLGMQVSSEGEEQFGSLAPHPQTKGTYNHNGTVDTYLETQGVAPFIAANKQYEKLYDHMVSVLALIDPEAIGKRQANREQADEMGEGTLISDWMDIDRVLAETSDITAQQAVERHISALEAKVNALAEEAASAG